MNSDDAGSPVEKPVSGTPRDYSEDLYSLYFELIDVDGTAEQMLRNFLGPLHAQRVQRLAHGFEFFPAVDVTWWDGGLMPPRPADLEPGRRMGNDDGGILLIGEKGKIMAGCYGESPRLIPEANMKKNKLPKKTLERIPEGPDGHEKDWIRACKGGKPASSNFDYSGPLTECVLMGNLAVRFPERPLLWNGAAMEVTNDADANAYVKRRYREGWKLS